MTSVQIRGMHASESPRFREICKGYKGTFSDFIKSMSSNEEKLAFWHYDEIKKRSNNPNVREIFYKPNGFHELAADLLQQPDELTPQMLYQLTDLMQHNCSESQKIVLLKRLREFFTDIEKDLTASDISFVLDSLKFFSTIERPILVNQSLLDRYEIPAINAKEYEDFYSRHSSKFGLRDHVMFALLYVHQSGYKLSFVEGILNFIHSNYDEIESDNAYKTVFTFFRVVYDDFEKSSQEKDSIEQHPLFPTFKKFDQKFTFQGLPSIYRPHYTDLFYKSLESKVKESLPNISKFIWRCFRYLSKKGHLSAENRGYFFFYLCEQPIDLNQTEIKDLADNATKTWRSEDHKFGQMRAVRILSRLAFKGL